MNKHEVVSTGSGGDLSNVMSNLSNIGFPVKTDEDVNQVIMDVLPHLERIPCPPRGFYYKFEDESGAQLYLQGNTAQDIIGFNPAFKGKSRRKVGLTSGIERDTSELDGAFEGWSGPEKEGDIENSGEFPFVFDVPDFRLHEDIKLQTIIDLELAAFASDDFRVFETEKAYLESQTDEPKLSARSFFPFGVIADEEPVPPQAHCGLAGKIKEFEQRSNSLTKKNFCWFLVETLGGEIDIVADPKLVGDDPKVGGIVNGSFWLTGKIVRG